MSHAFDLPRAGIRVRSDGSCLMVMEAGSRWPSWIARDAVSSLVLQGRNESASELAARSIGAIDVVRSTRGALRTLLLAAGNALGVDTFAARVLICRAAVACMPARKPSLLVLCGHQALPPEARHELFSLAGALTGPLAGARVRVVVKLCDETPSVAPESSGIFERGDSGPRVREASS
jgi:hypothetical protein